MYKIMNDLGRRIQDFRKQLGLTQIQLAKKAGVSHTQMARYEIKGVQPPADILQKLADIFDTSIDYLVRGDKSNKIKDSLKDAELIKQFKKIDQLPEEEKGAILKIIAAYTRDCNTKQAYTS